MTLNIPGNGYLMPVFIIIVCVDIQCVTKYCTVVCQN